MIRNIIFLLVCCMLFGCATSQFVMKDVQFANSSSVAVQNSESQEKNLLIEPFESLGVYFTKAIRDGKVRTPKGIFPDILFGEYFPGRLHWKIWGATNDYKDVFGQTIFTGKPNFNGDILMTGIVENMDDDTKVMVFSTDCKFAYDFAANEYPIEDWDRMRKDQRYRAEFIRKNGTRLGDMKEDKEILSIIKKWNPYLTPNGILMSPLGEKELQIIAGINPRYSFSEKLVATGRFSLSADYIGVAVGIGIDLINAGRTPSAGWDFNSEFPNRRNMGLIIKYVCERKRQLIQTINIANAKLLKQQRK